MQEDKEKVHWIFDDRDPQELEAILSELEQDASQGRPHQVFSRSWESFDSREAICIRMLPGPVGRILGWRSVQQHHSELLLQSILDHFRERSVLRIEQLCALGAKETSVLLAANFQLITSLRQMCLQSDAFSSSRGATSGRLTLVPAAAFGTQGFADIIRATMADSQDMEDLTPLSDYPDNQLLENFSNGQSLRDMKFWFAVTQESVTVGCLLLQLHPTKAMEIVYIGLKPESRGQGLGSALIEQAQELAHEHFCDMLVTAVDAQNGPALKLYHRHKFQEYAGYDFLSIDL